MCGILVSTKDISQPVNKLLVNRGPDGIGLKNLDGINFLHTLLSMTGEFTKQPIVNNNVVFLLNGEIYNYKDKKNYPFEYLFTIDRGHPEGNILDTEHSEIPAEHKCAHILALDDGNYAAQPNNRILWDAPNYTVGDGVPDYSVQTTKWNVENKDWLTEDSDKMFYDVEEKVKAEDDSYE